MKRNGNNSLEHLICCRLKTAIGSKACINSNGNGNGINTQTAHHFLVNFELNVRMKIQNMKSVFIVSTIFFDFFG